MTKFPLLLLALAGLSGCAVMHRSAIGEKLPDQGAPPDAIELNISDLGVDRAAIARDLSAVARSGGSSLRGVGQALEFFTWATSQSPRTGKPTSTDTWADDVPLELRLRCKGGVISGIQTLRESADYPYVSGEIVRVRAFCHRGV